MKLKDEAKNWEPIAGVPWRDMPDAEFETVSAAYDEQFSDQPRSLARWFEHVDDTITAAAARGAHTKKSGTAAGGSD
jgi:hypothetical protein